MRRKHCTRCSARQKLGAGAVLHTVHHVYALNQFMWAARCWVLQHQHRLCRGSCQECAYLGTSPRCPGLLPSRQSWCLCRQCSQAHPGQAAHTCNTQPQQQQEQTCDSWPPPGGTICRIAARLQLRLNAKRHDVQACLRWIQPLLHIESGRLSKVNMRVQGRTYSQNCWLVLLKMSVAGSTLLKPWGDRHSAISSLVITSSSLQKKDGLACNIQQYFTSLGPTAHVARLPSAADGVLTPGLNTCQVLDELPSPHVCHHLTALLLGQLCADLHVCIKHDNQLPKRDLARLGDVLLVDDVLQGVVEVGRLPIDLPLGTGPAHMH